MSPQNESSQPSALKGKWIVVTRPAHQAGVIQKKLEEAGANVILFPLLEITQPKQATLARQQLANIDSYDLVIFVSPNAVEQSLPWLDTSKLTNGENQVAAIGIKTASALKRHGINPDICPRQHFNSETFLNLPEIQALGSSESNVKKVAIIRGEDGRQLLHDTLKKQGVSVDNINTYRRRCPQKSSTLLKQHYEHGELDIILLTSGTSISNLFKLTENEDWINKVNLLVGSQRMRLQVPGEFSGKLWVADDPSDETFFKKLINIDLKANGDLDANA